MTLTPTRSHGNVSCRVVGRGPVSVAVKVFLQLAQGMVETGPGDDADHTLCCPDDPVDWDEVRALVEDPRAGLVVISVPRSDGALESKAKELGVQAVIPLDATIEPAAADLLAFLGRTQILPQEEARRFPSLSPMESKVIERIGAGQTNEQIAGELFLSLNTVKTYIRSAYRKMGVERRSQAVAWALRN